jgi:hypothetical protein
VWGWLIVTLFLSIGQLIRIIGFRRRVCAAIPAPDLLVQEAERISRRLGVRAPELLAIAGLGTPVLWCLGRPRLLLPERLTKTLGLDRWQGILTHELAHLRRHDHWVSRLELAAGLFWWWNPLYWLIRARLDAEAELACDAWVVWAMPERRLLYAEVLFEICATLSLARSPAPALGAAGSGRSFERRLTMILHDNVSCRLSPFGLFGACLLLLFALPSWSAAKPAAVDFRAGLASTSSAPTAGGASASASLLAIDDDDQKVVNGDKDEDSSNDADDDDDDDRRASRARAKAQAAKAKAKAEAARAKAKARAKKSESDIGKEAENKFGPGSDFEKKMEQLGEKIGKDIESKFGPDFEKKMEELGEKIGKEMEAKFGPGSDFEKKMKALGKEMEEKFGPGSEFEKKMKGLGEDMKAKFGPGSEFAKKMKEQAESASKLERKLAKKPSSSEARAEGSRAKDDSKAALKARDRRRERRIRELEAQVSKLLNEIKALKDEGERDDDDEK